MDLIEDLDAYEVRYLEDILDILTYYVDRSLFAETYHRTVSARDA